MPDEPSEKPKADPKVQPKAPLITSAFINKGAKTFAPAAVRRRRGAAATAPASKPSGPAITVTAPGAAVNSTSDNANATPPPEPPSVTQLPTPAATQENGLQQNEPAESSAPVPAITTPGSDATPADSTLRPPSTPADSAPKPLSEPTHTVDESQNNGVAESSAAPAPEPLAAKVPETPPATVPSAPETVESVEETQSVEGNLPSAPPAESRPIEPTVSATETAPPAEFGPVEIILATEIAPAAPANESTNAADQPSKGTPPATVGNNDGDSVQVEIERQIYTAGEPTTQDAAMTRPRSRNLPWTAVNETQGDDEAGPSTTTPQTKPRRKRKAITLREIDEEDGQEAAEQETRKRPKRASAKARGKRKAPETAGDDDEHEPVAPKKARKPRKDKGKKRAAPVGDEDEAGEVAEGEAVVGEVSRPRKRRRKQSTAQAEDQTEGAEGDQQPKRKGRPPREPTPSDAEDEVIDPSTTLMTSLASRNIRVGKLSEREKKLRTINWEEVKQRRQEREMAQNAQQAQAELNRRREALEEAVTPEPDANRPQYQLIGGEMVLVAARQALDPDALAQRELDNMEVVDEDELTNPINHKSFLRNNKRFPNEFLLPGQGKRWSADDTARFWRAIEVCGTDFAMIAKLFPGVSRTSIKNKFTREERLHGQFLKEKLHGPMDPDWEYFLQESQRGDGDFADVDRIKREMAEQEAEFERQLKEAREEHEEEMRQRRLAGVDDEDTGGETNAQSKKKGKGKGKEKAVEKALILHGDEEILGTISDDENW